MNTFKTNSVTAWVVAAVLLGGCGILKKKQTDATPSATATAQTAATVATTAPTALTPPPEPDTAAAVADEAIAAPEDFEDEAFEKVSDKTYKTELDGLKKEIEAK
jgi:hypothetical protein